MNIIKRKFLINDIPADLQNFKKKEILQWYFTHYKKDIKIKQNINFKNNRKYKSHFIKQNQKNRLIKQEDYKKISEKAFLDYREFAQQNQVNKIKYSIDYQGQTIDIYKFLGELNWLWIAEIIFENKKQSDNFDPPSRFYKEITKQKESDNKFLAIYWMQKLIQKNNYKSILINFQIKDFYNQEAKKYTETRKKHRWDVEILLQTIQTHPENKIRILEIWCGSGRFLEHLKQIKDKKIDYIWVDISESLIQEAKKIKNPTNIKTEFICQNMLNYLKDSKQESFDIVIWIASFQHLADKKQRHLASKHIYKTLKYDWLFIMTNRSFSTRFLQKYRQTIIKNWLSKLLNYKNIERNSLKIAWKNKDKTYYRFYHIFTLKELHRILSQSGFIIKKLWYLNKNWEEIADWKEANNSVSIAKKTIFNN